MRQFLIFNLAGPMAAWGEAAPGESRATALRPTRSALLGLLASALGLRRGDEEGQRALARDLLFGIRVEKTGEVVSDYHTVQTVKLPRGLVATTRRDQVVLTGRHRLPTILSRRNYQAEAAYSVGVCQTSASARWNLGDLEQALDEPAFPLFLGRRSCPPGLPLNPRRVEAETFRAAFEASEDGVFRDAVEEVGTPWSPEGLYWEGLADLGGPAPATTERRRDVPTSRRKRTFGTRQEFFAPWTLEEEAHVPESR